MTIPLGRSFVEFLVVGRETYGIYCEVTSRSFMHAEFDVYVLAA